MGLASNANAILTTTLEAVGTSGSAVISSGGKLVTGFAVGETITFRLFAQITGANTDISDDGLISLAGSFLSNGGTARGNLSAFRTPNANTNINGVQGVAGLGFLGTGGSNGTIVDLDGDTDLDVGSNDPTDSTGFFAARANSAPTPNFQGHHTDASGLDTTNPFGNRLLVGTAKMVITTVGSGTEVNFRKRESNNGGALWVEDSQAVDDGSGNFTYTGSRNYDPQNPTQWVNLTGVILGGGTTPEPASLGLIGVAGLMLARRRRH